MCRRALGSLCVDMKVRFIFERKSSNDAYRSSTRQVQDEAWSHPLDKTECGMPLLLFKNHLADFRTLKGFFWLAAPGE